MYYHYYYGNIYILPYKCIVIIIECIDGGIYIVTVMLRNDNYSHTILHIKFNCNYDFRFGSQKKTLRFLRFVFIYRFHDPAVRSGSCLSICVGSWAHCYIYM